MDRSGTGQRVRVHGVICLETFDDIRSVGDPYERKPEIIDAIQEPLID